MVNWHRSDLHFELEANLGSWKSKISSHHGRVTWEVSNRAELHPIGSIHGPAKTVDEARSLCEIVLEGLVKGFTDSDNARLVAVIEESVPHK